MVKQKKLKAILIEKEIEQKKLAEYLKISREALNKKLNGKIRFSLEEAFLVSEFLDKAIEEVFLSSEK